MKAFSYLISALVYGAILTFLYYSWGIDAVIIGSIVIFLTLFSEFLADFKDYTREERNRQLEAEGNEMFIEKAKKHFGIKDEK